MKPILKVGIYSKPIKLFFSAELFLGFHPARGGDSLQDQGNTRQICRMNLLDIDLADQIVEDAVALSSNPESLIVQTPNDRRIILISTVPWAYVTNSLFRF